MRYPIRYRAIPEGVLVLYPDFADTEVVGKTKGEAKAKALPKLLAFMNYMMAEYFALPFPSPPKRGWDTLTLPLHSEMKILLYRQLLTLDWSRDFLAQRMGIDKSQRTRAMRNLFNLNYHSRIGTLTAAAAVMGVNFQVTIVPANED